jgi:ABC-type transport system involved in cytochrome c biogenesis permease subunit
MFDYLANPTRFMRLADWLLLPLTLLASVMLLAGLYFGLVASPPDYQQGDTVRIMYVHVPAAMSRWGSAGCSILSGDTRLPMSRFARWRRLVRCSPF